MADETIIEKKVQIKDFIDAARPQISAKFFQFLVNELQIAKTDRAVDQIRNLAIMKLENEADRIFWDILKKVVDIIM
jgi:hypothetical protein